MIKATLLFRKTLYLFAISTCYAVDGNVKVAVRQMLIQCLFGGEVSSEADFAARDCKGLTLLLLLHIWSHWNLAAIFQHKIISLQFHSFLGAVGEKVPLRNQNGRKLRKIICCCIAQFLL